MALCLSCAGCSKDDTPDEKIISDVQVPESTPENPTAPGETVTIRGKGFTESSEIWLRAVWTKSTEDEVQAEIVSVSNEEITFIAPDVAGERNVVLKQDGQEQVLGTMFFEQPETPAIPLKRIIESSFSIDGGTFKFRYENNKLAEMVETSDEFTDSHKFDYGSDGELASVGRFDSQSGEKLSEKRFEYIDSETILVHETYQDDPEANGTMTLTLNTAGLLIELTDGEDYTETFEYDDAGNVAKRTESYRSSAEKYVYAYEYDDKVSYLTNQGLPAWYWVYERHDNMTPFAGKNNAISETCSEGRSLFRYDYDEAGYPVAIYDAKENVKIGAFVYESIED